MTMLMHETINLEEITLDEAKQWVLPRVKICGTTSKNGRKYPLQVLSEACPLYEGSSFFAGHLADPKTGKRAYQDLIGRITNPRIENEALYGDLELNPKKTLSEAVIWDFINNTKRIGLSHQIEGDLEGDVVTKIDKVYSVDLVINPATTQSLKEEEEGFVSGEQNKMKELEKALSETLSGLEAVQKTNQQLIQEIEELKIKANRPVPQSKFPLPTLNKPVEQFNIETFVKTLKRR